MANSKIIDRGYFVAYHTGTKQSFDIETQEFANGIRFNNVTSVNKKDFYLAIARLMEQMAKELE